MVQKFSLMLCRSHLHEKRLVEVISAKGGSTHITNPKVYILFPHCSVNVYKLCAIKTWKHVCAILVYADCVQCYPDFMINLCRRVHIMFVVTIVTFMYAKFSNLFTVDNEHSFAS